MSEARGFEVEKSTVINYHNGYKPSAYSAENSTAQLTPGPPSAPDWQFESSVVVPLMKLLNTAWMMGLPLESGRGWRPV